MLHRHCAEVGRDPADVRITSLSSVLVGDRDVGSRAIAGDVEDHVGCFRALAEAGVQTAMVRLLDVADEGALERFAPVIEAFR